MEMLSLPKKSRRYSAAAARVPRIIATTVAKAAICADSLIASSTSGRARATLNQCRVKPCGGKLKPALSVLKAYIKMIRIGKWRNTNPPQAASFRPQDAFSECIEGPQAFDDGQVHGDQHDRH